MQKSKALAPIDLRIQEWMQRLIDLTRRNRLLYFRETKSSKSSNLFISEPDVSTVFARLFVEEKPWKFWLPPLEEDETTVQRALIDNKKSLTNSSQNRARKKQDELVCGDTGRKELERILMNLYRRSNTDYRERGVRILYCVFGSLLWNESETNNAVKSPLILCPVELRRETARDPFLLSLAEDELILNPALQVKLQRDFRIELPPLPDDWETTSLSPYFELVRKLGRPLDWSVEATSFLGLFSFHKLVMYQDLAANTEEIREHSFIKALGGEPYLDVFPENIPQETELDSIQEPEDTYQILDADSSQQVCIQSALRGQSLVLQGPPGTGKSQTIANIIAEFIARGKTVLFVSDKIAALEVVIKRLQMAGLGDFCLELHSHKANKRQVVSELKRCLDETIVPEQLPSQSQFEKLKTLREKLNSYVLALHTARQPLGESAYSVLGKLARLDAFPFVPLRIRALDKVGPKAMQKCEDLVRRLSGIWQVAEEGEKFPWLRCREPQFTLEVRARWLSFLNSSIQFGEDLKLAFEQFSSAISVPVPSNLASVDWLIQVGKHLGESPAPDPSWFTSQEMAELFKEAESYRGLCQAFWKIRTELNRDYEAGFFQIEAGLADSLVSAWTSTTNLIPYYDQEGTRLIVECRNILEFFEYTESFLKDTVLRTTELADHLELESSGLTLERSNEIARLALLCKEEKRPESRWLDPANLGQTQNSSAQLRPVYDEYNRQRNDLLSNYDEAVTHLDIDQLIDRYTRFQKRPFCTDISEIHDWVGQLAQYHLRSADSLVAQAGTVKELEADLAELGELLGLPVRGITAERAEELARLATLCSSSTRPEASWLTPAAIQVVRNVVNRNRPKFAEHNKGKKDLLARYNESFFDLDVDALIDHFSGALYHPILRWLHPGYYRDKKSILRTTRKPSWPSSVLQDLIESRELIRLDKRIENDREQVRTLLISYDRGYDTDFDLVEQALAVGTEAIKLSGMSPIPENLVTNLSYGNVPNARIATVASRILNTTRQWNEISTDIAKTIPLEDLYKIRDFIRTRRRLDDRRPLAKELFGSYYTGFDTDFDSINQALDIAKEAITLARVLPVPFAITKALTSDTASLPRILSLADRIIDDTRKWDNAALKFKNTGLPLAISELCEVREWIEALLPPLKELTKIIERVTQFCKPSVLIDLASLVVSLKKNDELHSNISRAAI